MTIVEFIKDWYDTNFVIMINFSYFVKGNNVGSISFLMHSSNYVIVWEWHLVA
jgi:hypothetical protein